MQWFWLLHEVKSFVLVWQLFLAIWRGMQCIIFIWRILLQCFHSLKSFLIFIFDVVSKHIGPQWCKVTKYIYLSTVLKYSFEVFVLYLSISNFQSFYFYSTTSGIQILCFTPQNVAFDNIKHTFKALALCHAYRLFESSQYISS